MEILKEQTQAKEAATLDTNGERQPINVYVSVNRDELASAIEEGIDKATEDLTAHFQKQTKLFMFIFSGILLILVFIAIILSSYHNMPLR